jgi:hypothetical protein
MGLLEVDWETHGWQRILFTVVPLATYVVATLLCVAFFKKKTREAVSHEWNRRSVLPIACGAALSLPVVGTGFTLMHDIRYVLWRLIWTDAVRWRIAAAVLAAAVVFSVLRAVQRSRRRDFFEAAILTFLPVFGWFCVVADIDFLLVLSSGLVAGELVFFGSRYSLPPQIESKSSQARAATTG